MRWLLLLFLSIPVSASSSIEHSLEQLYGSKFSFHADQVTKIHEGTHSLHEKLRKTSSKPFNYPLVYPGLFHTEITDPKFKKHNVSQCIPKEFRGSYYDAYIIEKQEWDDRPIYLIEEWIAYLAGLEHIIEIKQQTNPTLSVRESTLGLSELMIYGNGLSTCLQKQNAATPELLRVVRLLNSHSLNIIERSRRIPALMSEQSESLLKKWIGSGRPHPTHQKF